MQLIEEVGNRELVVGIANLSEACRLVLAHLFSRDFESVFVSVFLSRLDDRLVKLPLRLRRFDRLIAALLHPGADLVQIILPVTSGDVGLKLV